MVDQPHHNKRDNKRDNKRKRSERSLIAQLRLRLTFAIILLVVVLILSSVAGIIVAIRDYRVLGALCIAMIAVIIFIWRTFTHYEYLQRQSLDNLKEATEAFGNGDLSARVKESPDVAFNEVGQTFNSMAMTLQKQSQAIKDRDILEQVLQLNTILTASLDLATLIQTFFQRVLSLLDIQVIALYLYDAQSKSLSLFSSRGLELEGIQTSFALGEGLPGRVAQDREPLLVSERMPYEEQTGLSSIKTIAGAVLPSSMYHLPLTQGHDLLGVLAVGSLYPMSSQARNILQVIASNLAAAIRNAQTYEHIQKQANELADYAHQQELSNRALRQQKDELTVLNSALEEANRVRSQFLSTMSHELRTPLASIIGFGQMILRSEKRSPLTEKQHSNINRILKNAEHLLGLINDVLDLAKIEAGRMDVNAVEVNLKELIASIVDEMRSIAIERRLALHVAVAEDVPTIETDPRKVHQILLNLVSNALKFTEKGSVTISATLQTRGGNHNKAEQVAIEVRDTGIGISREKQEHIFDAFYQVDSSNSRNYGGTGLGLSIVRELTTLLGGRVEIQSEPGQGSTFTIVLPIHLHDQRYMQDMRLNTLHQSGNLFGRQVAMKPVHVDTSRLELPQGGDGEYLVVAIDDNPDVLQLITASLEQTPYRVVGVQDSTQAVAVIQELKPKAITLDIMMPKVNGWQILHQLKSNPMTASIPVVLLTVLEDRSAGYVLGADEYLVKPVARDALLSVLQQLTQKQSAALNMDGTTNKEGSGIEQARPDLLMMLVNIDDSKVSVEQTSDDVIVDQASSPQLPPSVTPET